MNISQPRDRKKRSNSCPRAGPATNCRSSLSPISRAALPKRRRRYISPNSLRLQGYRVLAIDLDPQASLSAMFGYQPEFDIGEEETLYGAIRYMTCADDQCATWCGRPISPALDSVPGNLELHGVRTSHAARPGERSLRGRDSSSRASAMRLQRSKMILTLSSSIALRSLAISPYARSARRPPCW